MRLFNNVHYYLNLQTKNINFFTKYLEGRKNTLKSSYYVVPYCLCLLDDFLCLLCFIEAGFGQARLGGFFAHLRGPQEFTWLY